MQVLFYNVQFVLPGYRDHQRAHKIRSFLLSQSSDIIGLCEVYLPTLRKILVDDESILNRYPYRIINLGGKDKNWIHSGLVLLSKYPILEAKRYEFENQLYEPIISWNLRTKRDLIFAKIRHHTENIGIFLTHLQFGHCEEKINMRSKQIEELPDIINNCWDLRKPTILMGDLNVKAEHHQYKELIEILSPLEDCWTQIHPHDSGYTYEYANTRQIFMEDTRLDYIFSTKSIRPQKVVIKKPRWSTPKQEWKPSKDFSLLTKILIMISFLLRIFDIPKALILEYQRYRQGLPYRFQVDHDLSDHYPIMGIMEIEVQQSTQILAISKKLSQVKIVQ